MTVQKLISKALAEVDIERDDERNVIDEISSGDFAKVDRKKLMSLVKVLKARILKERTMVKAIEKILSKK